MNIRMLSIQINTELYGFICHINTTNKQQKFVAVSYISDSLYWANDPTEPP